MIEFLRASDELKGATPGLTRSKPRLPRRYISDASTTVGLCGMSLHAGVLAYWSYAFTSGAVRALFTSRHDRPSD
jgi:hypothetical protein